MYLNNNCKYGFYVQRDSWATVFAKILEIGICMKTFFDPSGINTKIKIFFFSPPEKKCPLKLIIIKYIQKKINLFGRNAKEN